MDFLNTILTFPGKIIANLLFDYLVIVWLIVFTVIIGLLVFHYFRKKIEFYNIALILGSILLAFTPSTFRFASYDSKLFWVFIFSSTAIGFIYYFIEKRNTVPVQIHLDTSSTNQAIEESMLYRKHYIFLAVLIFIFSLYLRTFQIEKYPAGYSYWELNTVEEVINYDEGKLNLKYYLSLFKMPHINLASESPIIMGLAIPFYKVVGISLVSTRYFYTLWGLAGLIFLFLYLREHFSITSSIFLVSFTSLELINVIFSRTGFNFITSFTYTVFVLYLLEITFKQQKLYFSVPLAFFLGLAVFGSNYLYLATKAVMLIVFLILAYKITFKKTVLLQNVVPLAVLFLTFSWIVYWYTNGNVKTLWPSDRGYLSAENISMVEFIKGAFNALMINFKSSFNKIVFMERAVHSLSKFKEGGLISGPALCFIPFGVGYILAGVRAERYFSLILITLVTLLPPLLGVPIARRLLLFLSFFLIFPGITTVLLYDQIQRVLAGEMKERTMLIPALFFILLLFSYNLYIFIDVNNNMVKVNPVTMPFADSGWGDTMYSRYTTALAKEIKELVKHDDVLFYYSDVLHENPTGPTGAYEQILIESYSNTKKGGKLIWMNPFHQGFQRVQLFDKLYFHKFETALRMILDSTRDVKVIFIKPLADEMIIYEKLKVFFPEAVNEERMGDTSEDKVFMLSIPHNEIENIKSQKLVSSVFSSEAISRLIKEKIKNDFYFNGYFLLERNSQILLKNNMADLLEITIDDFKLTDQARSLSFSKGIHEVKIRTIHKEPFIAMNVTPNGPQSFSASIVAVPNVVKLNKLNTSEVYPYAWAVEKSVSYTNRYNTHAFYYNYDDQYYYSYNNELYNPSGRSPIPDNSPLIDKILQKDDKIYLVQYESMNRGYLTIYDLSYKKIKTSELNGYPFDFFSDRDGNFYVTYLNRNKITIFKPGFVQETWDTSTFSEFPIWNGDVDRNGDIVLLSGSGQVFVFDKNKRLYNSFEADASWTANLELIKSRGGILVDNGIIHVLDPIEESIKSYDKSGHRLYNDTGDSLFIIPPNFKIDFMQKLNDKIVLVGPSITGEILILKREEIKAKEQGGISLSLLQFEPSEVSVGWGKYSIDPFPRLLQTVNNERYNNFIFAHAPSHLAYYLEGMFESLSVGYGLDDMDGHDAGSVKFIIKGDGKQLFVSKVIRAFAPIENVRVDIKGVNKLELITDPTEDGYLYDQSVWISPVLHAQQNRDLNADRTKTRPYSEKDSGYYVK